jgi:aminoglycoside 2'-N-acetyltransferase I
MPEEFRVASHSALTGSELSALRGLFDREYFAEYGAWDPDRPYGYSPADVHTLAFVDSALVGHVGFQVRTITVGGEELMVAGTGGVLVDEVARGSGLGRRLMRRAQESMWDDERSQFGYLGCREAVVPFYASAGWRRVRAVERHASMHDPRSTVVSSDGPLLIFPIRGVDWPAGEIDLRGTPW